MMTYEDFNKELDDLREQYAAVRQKEVELEERYIASNLPFKFKENMYLTVQLMVTEKTLELLTDAQKKMKKNQLGHVYEVTGCCHTMLIMEGGELRPDFWYKNYRRTDKVVGIKAAKQVISSCKLCLKYKDGLCYRLGGKNISEKCAVGKVGDDNLTCPKYEERTELWRKNGEQYIHYPCVTILRHSNPLKYRIYSEDWKTYTEWEESIIKCNYVEKPDI